jgi:hypothetical protein
LLAARDFDVTLPNKPRPWWQVFLGSQGNKAQELVDVANSILGLYNLRLLAVTENKTTDQTAGSTTEEDVAIDWVVAISGFVKSLVTRKADHETSFNDPDSFLWEYQKEVLEKEVQRNM